MSLNQKIREELKQIPFGKNCCRKAYLCGLLYGAQRCETSKYYAVRLYGEDDAKTAAALIDAHFFTGKKTDIVPTARGGHRAYELSFNSKALCSVFADIDGKGADIGTAVGKRCVECEQSFLRGLFLSSATLSTPKSGYNLEFSVVNERRAAALSALLGACVAEPSVTHRANKIGVYYKSNVKISDFLYLIGAHRASFDFTNYSIERQIRNSENRVTNCLTGNISRTVDANKRVVAAIGKLKKNGGFDRLTEELAYTAELRLENDVASLSELALMHNPPISKSGLNARLKKIIAMAEEE